TCSMQCYEFHHYGNGGQLLPGITLDFDLGTPRAKMFSAHTLHADLGDSQPLLLTPDFAESRSAISQCERGFVLDRCDVEKRADLWAIQETPQTKDDALVVCSLLARGPRLDYVSTGTGSDVLA